MGQYHGTISRSQGLNGTPDIKFLTKWDTTLSILYKGHRQTKTRPASAQIHSNFRLKKAVTDMTHICMISGKFWSSSCLQSVLSNISGPSGEMQGRGANLLQVKTATLTSSLALWIAFLSVEPPQRIAS